MQFTPFTAMMLFLMTFVAARFVVAIVQDLGKRAARRKEHV